MGLDQEKINRIQEQHTAIMFQSTAINETMVEPSVFYANTVNFPYNLLDCFSKVLQTSLGS
jgi:hypothetical protein